MLLQIRLKQEDKKIANMILEKVETDFLEVIDYTSVLSSDIDTDELIEVEDTERANQLLKSGIWRYERCRNTTGNHLLIRRKRK